MLHNRKLGTPINKQHHQTKHFRIIPTEQRIWEILQEGKSTECCFTWTEGKQHPLWKNEHKCNKPAMYLVGKGQKSYWGEKGIPYCEEHAFIAHFKERQGRMYLSRLKKLRELVRITIRPNIKSLDLDFPFVEIKLNDLEHLVRKIRR